MYIGFRVLILLLLILVFSLISAKYADENNKQ